MYRLRAVGHKGIIHCAMITIGKSGYRISSNPLYYPGNFSIKLKPFKNKILVKKKLGFLPVFSSFSSFSCKHFSLVNEKNSNSNLFDLSVFVIIQLKMSSSHMTFLNTCCAYHTQKLTHLPPYYCLCLNSEEHIYYGFQYSN